MFDAGFVNVHFLEPTRKGVIFLENAAILLVGGRTDALDLAVGERRFQQVGGVHGAAGGRTRADNHVDFVDEQNGIGLGGQFFQHGFQTQLKIATIFGARQQRAHIQRVHVGILQHVGYVVLDDAPRQPFSDGGLAHARFAHQQRIVLAAAAQGLNHPLQFQFAPDQRVDLATQGLGIEVERVIFQRTVGHGFIVVTLGSGWLRIGGSRFCFLAFTVGNEIHQVDAPHTLLGQEVHGMGVFFTEQCDQNGGTIHFLALSTALGGLHMQDGALNHALKAHGGLRFAFDVAGHDWGVRVDKVG